MLSFVNKQWRLCPYLVTYTEFGNERQVYAYDRKYWEDMAEKWDHIDLVSIVEVEYTEEQLQRYEEVKGFPEDFGSAYSEYVEKGFVSEDNKLPANHPFNMILLSNGVIVESSDNANGNFVKFADGTLIAKGSFVESVDINDNGVLEKTLIFPHVFKGEPSIIPSANFGENTLEVSIVRADVVRFNVKVKIGLNRGDVNLSYIAIGRWK